MKTKKVLLSGYYGFDNFGDDAILQVLVSHLRSGELQPEITAISKNPEKTKELYNVNSIYTFDLASLIKNIAACDVFVSGGGSLLQDKTSVKSLLYYLFLIFTALLFGKKVCIYAQGIGPINSFIGSFMTSNLLKKASMITVRDINSYNLLKSWNINPVLTSDPVWDIECDSSQNLQSTKRLVGIQLREWPSLTSEKVEALAHSIAANFDDENTQLVVIPLQPAKDTVISNEITEILKTKCTKAEVNFIQPESIQDSIKALNSLDLILAMRFHAELITIKFAVPTLALCYDPKVESISKEAEVPYVWIEDISVDNMDSKIKELLQSQSILREQLKVFSEKKAVESRQNRDLLQDVLSGK